MPYQRRYRFGAGGLMRVHRFQAGGLMRAIGVAESKLMDRLTKDLGPNKRYLTIDTLIIRQLSNNPYGDIISMGYYYEENGELVADPEIIFLRLRDIELRASKHHLTQYANYCPILYRVDSLGIYKECVFSGESGSSFSIFDPRSFSTFNPREQKKQASFATKWLREIKLKQKLMVKKL